MRPSLLPPLVALLCASASANAYQGTRIKSSAADPRDVRKSEEVAEAQRVMNDYGACVVKNARRRVEAALKIFPGTKESYDAMLKLATSECIMHGTLRFKVELLRGSLFDALYDADFKSVPVNVISAPQIDYFASAPDSSSEEVRQQVGLRQFADCIVRTNPTSTRSLVTSEVGSGTERVAFEQLMPAASQCLTKGAEVRFSRPMLRGLVAETIYRLSQAAAASQPPTG